MRSYDEAIAAARSVPPFSNATEGDAWMGNWCDRCRRDAPFKRGQSKEGCPLIMIAYMGRTPAEWINERPESLADRYHCTEYRPDNEDGDDEPEPRWDPEMPGQDDLFAAATLGQIESELSQPTEVSHA